MKMHLTKSVIALFCIMFILLYASAVFLPHDHSGCDNECAACTAIESCKKLFAGLAVCVLVAGFIPLDQAFTIAAIHGCIILKNTPVKLRVKLSD